MQILEWKTPMGAIVFAVSLIDDKGNLAVMVKDSMITSFTEKFRGKKKNEGTDSSPADKKKSSISLSSLVKRRKNSSSGGSIKDMGITLEDFEPPEIPGDTPELNGNKDDEKSNVKLLAEKWESLQDIPLASATVDENSKVPNKPSRFNFFKKKPDRYTDENGEELSNDKTKGKTRRKKTSSGISQISSASDLSYKDAQGEEPAIEPAEKGVRFEVDSENLEFPPDFQAKLDTVADQVD
jgi:hypothetical protein